MKFFLFFFIVFFTSLKTYSHGTILVSGVEHNEGYIDVKIYSNKESFLKEELAAENIRKKPTNGETIIPFSKMQADSKASSS